MKKYLNFFTIILFAAAAAVFIAPMFGWSPSAVFTVAILSSLVPTPAGVLASKITMQGQRLMYECALEALEGAGYTQQGAILTQWNLRSEVAMAANTTSYQLPLTQQQSNNATIASLRLLKQTDILIVYGVRVYCAVAASASGVANKLFTYGNTTVFPTSTSAADIDKAYSNGGLQLNVNKQQVLPWWDLEKHYKVPVQQQVANAYYATTGPALLDSIDGSEDGFVPVSPSFVLSGDQDLEMYLNILTAQAAITSLSRWVVFFDGFLAQNTTRTANSNPR
jgi:hypothetical protein